MKLIFNFFIFIGAFIHWALIMVIQAFGWITAKFIFPIAWYNRNWVYSNNNIVARFLYLYLDTYEPYGDVHYLWEKGMTIEQVRALTGWAEFKHVYVWSAIRNPFWNFNYLIPLADYINHDNDEKLCVSVGNVRQNFKRVDDWIFMPVLKYVDQYGNYLNNRGPYLSAKYSRLGWSFNLWLWKGLPYFNFAFAGRFLWADKEIQIGMNHYRYMFRFKPYLFRRKPFYEDINVNS